MGTSATTGSKNGSDMANASLNGFTSSPSASSHSNLGPSSSCGTSPEAFTQSPTGPQALDTLTTIGEEHPSISTIEYPFAQFANNYLGGNYNLDWFVQQNGGQFDPQLFGNYREPQDNILATTSFDDLFAEPLETDFTMPYNVAPSPGITKKTNLIEDIDAQQHAIEEDTIQPGAMSCNQLWNKLQSCPKAQSGEFDLDGLCSELTKKAKCSGHGPVVAEQDFDTILQKYMGKDVPSDRMADKMGIKIEKGDISAQSVGM
ncbi:AP-1-like transcription factor YAP1 [Escovopsis weberi]|uniref:AP-1-like transcription factor YAP1 n=1 Tax=Escovopsis weberi TaxID=150374 RepID=A0A0M9VS39_ESCWE|nr:AP-1-like transcription factor YAP1 [Escovopsis weberi]